MLQLKSLFRETWRCAVCKHFLDFRATMAFILVSLELGGFQFQQTSLQEYPKHKLHPCNEWVNRGSCASHGYRIHCRACDADENMEAVVSFLSWLSLQVGGLWEAWVQRRTLRPGERHVRKPGGLGSSELQDRIHTARVPRKKPSASVNHTKA